MIPSMGVMIAGYIVFRCIEALCRPTAAFGSRDQQILVNVFASIGILVTCFLAIDLILRMP